MTAPLIKQYSRRNIIDNMHFMEFSAGNMQYSIMYPSHWTAIPQNGGRTNSVVAFYPPESEGNVQELSIVKELLENYDIDC